MGLVLVEIGGDYVRRYVTRACRTALLLTCIPGAAAHGAGQPVPASPERLTNLFNGRDLTGWEYIAGKPGDIVQVATVKDGVVSVPGKPNGYLATVASYADYVLHLEWRWSDLTPNPSTNGGVLVNISSGPVQQNLWPTSFQIQLKVQRAGDVLSMGEARFAETPTTAGTATAPSSTLARSGDTSEKPLGEWNSADITVRGASIDVSMNGVTQNRVTGCTPSSGKIGFQLEGHAFQLRNVTVSPLSTAR